jgi:carbonic anhydrase
VHATLEQLARPSTEQSRNLRSIVDRIRPAVAGLLERRPPPDPATLEQQAVLANIRMAVEQLRHGSEVLEQLIEEGLRVVGAEYSLETGLVEFLEDISA